MESESSGVGIYSKDEMGVNYSRQIRRLGPNEFFLYLNVDLGFIRCNFVNVVSSVKRTEVINWTGSSCYYDYKVGRRVELETGCGKAIPGGPYIVGRQYFNTTAILTANGVLRFKKLTIPWPRKQKEFDCFIAYLKGTLEVGEAASMDLFGNMMEP
ncbi:hypothetical protein SUGI_0828060 [Cryptomeria japonica]|nr:hypothetical protein SUGI_0828060 [Cryptomeria japonica]